MIGLWTPTGSTEADEHIPILLSQDTGGNTLENMLDSPSGLRPKDLCGRVERWNQTAEPMAWRAQGGVAELDPVVVVFREQACR